jgi:peptidyl-prolyl cis-trans isomerase SurA
MKGVQITKWGIVVLSVLISYLLVAEWTQGEEAPAPAALPELEINVVPPKAEVAAPAPETDLTKMIPLDTVVALVDSRAITLDDLQRASNPLLAAAARETPPEKWLEIRENILKRQLENLIYRELILLEAKKLGAQIQESRVREAIQSLREIKVAFDGDLAKYLVAKGLTYQQLFREVEEELIFGGMLREKVLPKMRASPEEIKLYYQRNIQKFTEEAAIHCFAITFMRKANLEEGAAVLTRAREALKKINDGSYFPDVAQQYSEDPAHAEKGGDWGWIKPGDMEKKASDAAFALKEGEHSGLVEADAAYWILWVKEKREKSVIPLSDAWKEIELAVKAQKQDLEIRRWGHRLSQNAAITYPVPLNEILRK